MNHVYFRYLLLSGSSCVYCTTGSRYRITYIYHHVLTHRIRILYNQKRGEVFLWCYKGSLSIQRTGAKYLPGNSHQARDPKAVVPVTHSLEVYKKAITVISWTVAPVLMKLCRQMKLKHDNEIWWLAWYQLDLSDWLVWSTKEDFRFSENQFFVFFLNF